MRLQNGYDPIVPRDFLQKRHLRQSHCKMSNPTFVQTVVLSLLTFVQSLIRLAQMLWYFGFILTFFPSKRLGVKRGISERLLAPFWCRGIGSYVVISYVGGGCYILKSVRCVLRSSKRKKMWKGGGEIRNRFEWVEKNLDFLWGLAARWR